MELTYADVVDLADQLANRHRYAELDSVYGVPRGGVPVAVMVANKLQLPLVDVPRAGSLVVDDLVDSGATLSRHPDHVRDALLRKPHSPDQLAPDAKEVTGWVTFPWEHDSAPTDAVVRLLQHIGEDPTRDGLLDTPRRVVKAWTEMTDGYGQDAREHLSVSFDVTADQMIVVPGIDFVSICEHHMLHFTGTATVGYIPDGRVLGLSKLARVVDVYARRLQVQERLTEQIANVINEAANPLGVGVRITARHSCMGLRGVRKPNAEMVTTALLGKFRNDPLVRAEFLDVATS